jgi:hypothetical protein
VRHDEQGCWPAGTLSRRRPTSGIALSDRNHPVLLQMPYRDGRLRPFG